MTTQPSPQNRVLQADSRTSTNFFDSDIILQHLLHRELNAEAHAAALPRWINLGKQAAGQMNDWSLIADKNPPQLIKRNFYGEDIDEIRFNAAYEQLKRIAVESGMFSIKWQPENRQKWGHWGHRLGFSLGFLYAMSETGLYCPLCMTDGVARLIDRYGTPDDRNTYLPHIYTENPDELFTGAMFLTEKAGGSDVGQNLVSATYQNDRYYTLNGEKWFCSNANAELIFALARINPQITGTRGLSLFLIEKKQPTGNRNPMNIIRLKDKIGVRSMASAEIILTDTWGKIFGKEGEGFRLMTDMINLSRLYNSVAAIAIARRALIEAYQFLTYRHTFGKNALQHALIRQKLLELQSIYLANFYLTWRAIRALDHADYHNQAEADLLRLVTPMVKKSTAEAAVYIARESMELMGGLGYIEDGVMPKLLRDALVLPIWEGAGNIMILDMWRAATKTTSLTALFSDIEQQIAHAPTPMKALIISHVENIKQSFEQAKTLPQDAQEIAAKQIFSDLTHIYQASCLAAYTDTQSETWNGLALSYLLNPSATSLPTIADITTLIGWQI